MCNMAQSFWTQIHMLYNINKEKAICWCCSNSSYKCWIIFNKTCVFNIPDSHQFAPWILLFWKNGVSKFVWQPKFNCNSSWDILSDKIIFAAVWQNLKLRSSKEGPRQTLFNHFLSFFQNIVLVEPGFKASKFLHKCEPPLCQS